ncbi:MAG: GspE/PulE family protein [Verrucomicrobiota bacterium]
MNSTSVLDLMKSRGYIDIAQSNEIEEIVNTSGGDVVEELANFGILEQTQTYAVIAEELGAEYVDLAEYTPPQELITTIPAGMARLHGAFPVNTDGQTLFVALTDPLNPQALEDLRFALGREISPVVADHHQVEAKIAQFYGGGADGEAMGDILGQLKALDFDGDDESDANAAPIVRYVDLVLAQAMQEQASDIHFEPFEDDFKIRYRVDGALYEMAPPPLHLSNTIISRVKVMSNLNIAEKRLPQDGRIQKTIGEKDVDFRVSTLPTANGESVVLRVLDRSNVALTLENIGLPVDIHEYIEDVILKPNGIFICTGPTGAGKTTTLYACLRKINTIDSKLLTAEDPVEYDFEGIIQCPTNDPINVSFSRLLRAFLRQDPDRIMVGEMRDLETAQIAIQASLTGHLVFSTLHTNDAPGAVTRLIDMGCEPFLVAATLEAVLGQRLLRKICTECKTAYDPSAAVLSQLDLSPEDIGGNQFFTGAGCEACAQTGNKGRRGLYELLDMNDPLREMVTERAPTVKLKQKAIELGMRTLREDGLRNIFEGNVTIEEVLKYT